MLEEHIGIASLSRTTRKKLRELDHVQIVHYRTTPDPAAVLLPHWMWVRIQFMLMAAKDILDAGEEKHAE